MRICPDLSFFARNFGHLFAKFGAFAFFPGFSEARTSRICKNPGFYEPRTSQLIIFRRNFRISANLRIFPEMLFLPYYHFRKSIRHVFRPAISCCVADNWEAHNVMLFTTDHNGALQRPGKKSLDFNAPIYNANAPITTPTRQLTTPRHRFTTPHAL